MKSMKFFLSAALVGSLCLATFCCKSRYIFKDEEELQALLEVEFPIGMEKSEVRARLSEMGATITQDRNIGFRTRDHESVCSSHFRTHLYAYSLPLRVDVIAFIGFDGDNRVCNVEVRKETDAL